MQLEEAVLRVQSAYPRIYLACHSRHQNARTTREHIGVAKSTLSEALSGLEERGFATRSRDGGDGREALILRTAAGTHAMSGGSVLEAAWLASVLDRLSGEARTRAVDGLELLAQAALAGGSHAR